MTKAGMKAGEAAAAARRVREAQALRANLARRKAQSRARDEVDDGPGDAEVGLEVGRDENGAGQLCR